MKTCVGATMAIDGMLYFIRSNLRVPRRRGSWSRG